MRPVVTSVFGRRKKRMLPVVTSVFGRIRREEAPALLPASGIKLLNVLLFSRFGAERCVPLGVYSSVNPHRWERSQVRTIPNMRIVENVTESCPEESYPLVYCGFG